MTPADLDFICAFAQARSGLVIRGERGFFVETRLAPLARREQLASVSDLVALVREQPAGSVARGAVEAMTIQDTGFFRDRVAFGALEALVLPELGAGKSRLRIWSAGCGYGQEAYSLSIIAAENESGLPKVEILATDLSTAALEKAQAGVYSHFEVQRGLPIRRLLAHFEQAEDSWRVSSALRQRVRWMRLNLVDAFKVQEGYDLILCRNVVSAFTPEVQEALLFRLDAALAPGGRLMLGAGEAAPQGFVATTASSCVFARAGEVRALGAAA